MTTHKTKPVGHLKPGDVVFFPASGDTYPVVSVEEHEILRDHISVSFAYTEIVPDGNGGQKTETRSTQPAPYYWKDNLLVVEEVK